MADTSGSSRDSIAALAEIRALEAQPWRYSFYAAVHLFETLYPEKPLLGRAKRPRQDVVRLASAVRLAFANSTVASLDLSGGPEKAKLYSQFLGLLGPNGPLPLHLTEYAFSRAQTYNDDTLLQFLDIFHHRALSLFYRAWADAVPTMQASRSDDRFGNFLSSFIGTRIEAATGTDALNDEAKKYLSGLFAQQRKNGENLERLLSVQFDVPVDIDQFQGTWAEFDEQNWTKLGVLERQNRLGISTVLGKRVWLTQNKITIRLGPLPLREFIRYLPGEMQHSALVAAVRLFTTDEFEWDLQLVLQQDEVPASRLGRQGRLGMTSWLGEYAKGVDNDEVRLRPDLTAALL